MFEGMVDRALSRTQVPQSLATEDESAAKATARAAPVDGLSISALVERIGSER